MPMLWIQSRVDYKHNLPQILSDGAQAQENMETTHQAQEEVEAQMEDARGGQSPPQGLQEACSKPWELEDIYFLFL